MARAFVLDLRVRPDGYITLCLAGKVKLVNRGKIKEGIEQCLTEERNKVVELLQSMGDRLSAKYRVMTVQRYKDTHDGREPSEDGHTVLIKTIKNIKYDVVMFRSLPEGEWDLEDYQDNSVRTTELLDDGSNIVTANQQDKKIKGHVDALSAVPNDLAIAYLDVGLSTVAAKQGVLDASAEQQQDRGPILQYSCAV